MTKGPDPRIFIGLAVAALVVGGGVLYLQYGQVGKANAALEAKRVEVDKAVTVTRDLDKSKAQIADLEAKLEHLEKGVQAYQYVPYMLKDLEQFGNQSGIAVLGVRTQPKPAPGPDTKVKKQPYDQVVVEIKGRGHYDDIEKFLAALKSFPQIVGVKTISLQPKAQNSLDGGSPQIDMVAQVVVFVFPDKSKTDATDKTDATMASSGAPTNG